MKEKILTMLSSTDSYVSGQEICDKLNVSRTAVWKNINKLKEEGYEIEAVTNKGYRLDKRPDILSSDEIKSKLDTKYFGRETYFFDEIDSTNTMAKKMAEEGAPEGRLVIAEIQTAGKGRRGRSWSSLKGSGIWMTFILRPKINPSNASMLTIIAAMAIKEAIDDTVTANTVIKWPNDVVVNGKKICGILTELSADPDYVNYVVVGVGINVNTESFPEDIAPVATSLFIETGEKIVRSSLVARIGSAFEKYYEQFLKTEDLSNIKDAYNSMLANNNNQVKILDPAGEYIGISNGINDYGELLVTDEDGVQRVVRSGEVSVRGIYGYV